MNYDVPLHYIMTNSIETRSKSNGNNIIVKFIHNNTFIKSVYSWHCQNYVEIGYSSLLFSFNTMYIHVIKNKKNF